MESQSMGVVAPQLGIKIPTELEAVLAASPSVQIPESTEQLVEWACPTNENDWYDVAYDVPGKGRITEARVCRVRNGICANYTDPYMRRRDPDCMVIADDLPTNKPRYDSRFGSRFTMLRQETLDWLSTQELTLLPFIAGRKGMGIEALAVVPLNASFFTFGLALLQGMLTPETLPQGFEPKAIVYVAPPFRHTHFAGKQMVVHNRRDALHELFSYNLYPGPSAKKGIYGMLLNLGEQEGWVTAHCSTVQVVTPYDNIVTIMHEGASGGGKSEMLEHIPRKYDGTLLLGHNTVTGENRYLVIPRTCELRPVTDDMALCHPSLQDTDGKLTVQDAEDAWFIRVNHINQYGTDPYLEKLTITPPEPLLFLSIDAVPNSTALIWEHVEDAPGKRCPNPRLVLPRRAVPNVVNGPVTIDIRSFGVRTPPCTREHPSYGIIGFFHILPPALAWLWRLTAPRGYDNPSIVQSEGMSSEGVGSYWPFATGRLVDQANLLLKQIERTSKTLYILCPNQHVGAWRVGFMAQHLVREYLARRGSARMRSNQLEVSRCPLLGYSPQSLLIEGTTIPPAFLRVHLQKEVGDEAYDSGAKQLTDFFIKQLQLYLEPDLLPLGKNIIDCCLAGGTVDDYANLMPM
jgi:hypothetical protein